MGWRAVASSFGWHVVLVLPVSCSSLLVSCNDDVSSRRRLWQNIDINVPVVMCSVFTRQNALQAKHCADARGEESFWRRVVLNLFLSMDLELKSNVKSLLDRTYGLGHMWLCSSLVYSRE